ncbi:MAG: hypothetical protein PWR10_2549 [Halanaerobiales bacterium]|nr:hypothetical protein [Halanaerobiales bacterium]
MQVYPLKHELNKHFILRLNTVEDHFPAHRHTFLEFSFVVEGKGIEIINGKKHDLKRGTFTLLLPYQVHEIIAEDGPLKLYNCNVGLETFFGPGKIIEELNEMVFASDNLPSYAHIEDKYFSKITNIFEELMEEGMRDRVWKNLLFNAKMVELFVIFDRTRRHYTPEGEEDLQKSKRYIWEIIFYLHNHYREDINLQSIANKFNISYSHLSTSFKELFGTTFHSFLNDIRIKHACGLLASTNMQIIDIAFEVGFNSYQTFSRVFRQLKGMSASEYRKKHS